jgi:atypical dual specificity phosphatase
MRWSLHALVEALSPATRYPLTVLFLYPALLVNRLICYFCPRRRRLWDRVHPNIVLGSVPAFRADVAALEREGVRAVVNMMAEWDANGALYKARGLAALHAPTIDFEEPPLAVALRCVAFVRAAVARGESVYVHCREGKGRSTCVVLAYLMVHEGLTAAAADAAIRRARPHIAVKWNRPLFTQLAAHLAEEAAAREARSDATAGLALRAAPTGP